MGVLNREQIRLAIESSPPLVEFYEDVDGQLQPNGFDLTVNQVARFLEAGQIGTTGSQRYLPRTEPLPYDEEHMLNLAPGPYLITFNEVVHLPPSLMALARPRSSMLRSGVTVLNAVWDAGYHGRSQALLVVYNPAGFHLARHAPIAQMVFMTLDHPTERGYAGNFQGENL